MRHALVPFALTLVVAASAAAQDALALTPSGDSAPLPAVRLLEPYPAGEAAARSFFGRVAARETTQLSFEIGGRLIAFAPREGKQVARGTVLAQLDPEALRLEVERAELSLRQSERAFARATQLASSNVASQVTAEDAETARDLADVALRDARKALADSTLVAPFDALVSRRIATDFANVAAGQPIVELHDMSELRVEIELPEQVLSRAGDLGKIAFIGEGQDGRELPLELAEVEGTTGPVGQSFRVALTIPEIADELLLPGASMTVRAALPGAGPAQGGTLPASAVLANTQNGFEVMVFRPDAPKSDAAEPGAPGLGASGAAGEANDTGSVERREVVLRAPTGMAYVVEGLGPQERIVAAGAHLLSDGQRVRVYRGLGSE